MGPAAMADTATPSSGYGSCSPHHSGMVYGASRCRQVVLLQVCGAVNVASLYGRIPTAHGTCQQPRYRCRLEKSATQTPAISWRLTSELRPSVAEPSALPTPLSLPTLARTIASLDAPMCSSPVDFAQVPGGREALGM